PWSASFGTTKKMSASAAAERPRASAAHAARRLFRNDILKGGPADDRKDRVVQGEEAEVAGAPACDAGADAADHHRDHERQEEQRQHELPRPARGRRGRDEGADGADSEIGERDGGDRWAVDRAEEDRVGRQRDHLDRREKAEDGERLAEPDRAAVARGEDEPVDDAVL